MGRGTLKMVELAEIAGLPRPEIDEIAGTVVVRFRSARTASTAVSDEWKEFDLTKRQLEILDAFKETA